MSFQETFRKLGLLEHVEALDSEDRELQELLAEALKMAKVHVGTITPKDIDQLKHNVHFIRNESEIIDDLITLLGVPADVPTRIRGGFMLYVPKRKMLFFSRTKFDLPGFAASKPPA